MNRQQGSVQMTKSSLHSCVPSLSLQSGAEGLMHRQELVGNAGSNIQAIQSLLGEEEEQCLGMSLFTEEKQRSKRRKQMLPRVMESGRSRLGQWWPPGFPPKVPFHIPAQLKPTVPLEPRYQIECRVIRFYYDMAHGTGKG